MKLRPYQEECVRRVLTAFETNKHGRELIVLPTGAGKTAVFTHVIHEMNQLYGLNTLIIAHRDELLDQAADKYRLIRPDAIIGKVGSGIHQYGGEVTVASIATISRPEHIKHLKAIGYGLIIIDEGHHMASRSYQQVLRALPDAFVLIVTATPQRLDGKKIIDKEPLYQASIIDMIKQGYLCDVKAIAIKTEVNLDEIHTQMGDFNEHELELAVNTPARNKRVVDAYLEHTPGKRAICFGVTVDHAEALAYAFNDYGIPTAVIKGDTPLEERKRLYHQFSTGALWVLCNVMVLTEGFDAPAVECVIMARPTQSQGLYIQQVGRGLRLHPDKKECVILDLTDNCLRHRIAPQNLHRVLNKTMQDGVSLLDALQREEEERPAKEAAAKQVIVRKLNDNRAKDVVFDLFALPAWEERADGLYVMDGVGHEKHRIALNPCKGSTGLYDVWARLAPHYRPQKWASVLSLDEAREFADKRAHMLIADETAVKLLDKARWGNDRITEGQKKMLNWYKIPITENMTKGQASDLIDKHKREIEQKKKAKAERAARKESQVSA